MASMITPPPKKPVSAFLLAKWGYGAPAVEEKHGPVEGVDRVEEILRLV